jgi:peptide-methionine (S)-S-oxide reductase
MFIKNNMIKYYNNKKIITKDNDLVIDEIKIDNNINACVFAGGCFWCIADPFYNIDGVIDVYSGYCGGEYINPKYEDVKYGNTGHKESILIIYDKNKISYYDLLKTYFENIDPFDDTGQFIYKGDSYQTAVFTNNENEINDFNNIVNYIENKYNNKVMVKLLNENIFYFAESEHQRFSINNIEKFKIEEEISGRNSFNKIKIE